jgi:predicted nuclease with TOPRIM domain
MNRKIFSVLPALSLLAAVPGGALAIDQIGLTGEFSLPDRSHNLVDSQDDYYDAVQRLQDANAALVRARESAMKEQQSSAAYVAAVKDVDDKFHTFTDKKNALVDDLEKKNPVFSQMKSQASAMDAQIESARQNPATTPEQFDELYKNRETFNRQWQQLENDAMERAGLSPLRQQWLDASKNLQDLQAKQQADVENSDKVKAAAAVADDARNSVQQARAAISGVAVSLEITSAEQAKAPDFLCRDAGAGFAGNDAWWTYGWNPLSRK